MNGGHLYRGRDVVLVAPAIVFEERLLSESAVPNFMAQPKNFVEARSVRDAAQTANARRFLVHP
ncbi:MAG: hypothetical protein R3C30_05755 [Hyphomonadaceae bacterium]